MTASKHPKKEVQEAIEYAVSENWRIIETGNSSHAFCRLYGPEKSRDGCKVSVWSTPRNEKGHARQIKRQIDRCRH